MSHDSRLPQHMFLGPDDVSRLGDPPKMITRSEANKYVGGLIAQQALAIGKKGRFTEKQIKEYAGILEKSFYASVYHYQQTGLEEPILVVNGEAYAPRTMRDWYDKPLKVYNPEMAGLAGLGIPILGDILGGIGNILSGVLNVLPADFVKTIGAVGAGMLAVKLGPKPPKPPAPPPPTPTGSTESGYTVDGKIYDATGHEMIKGASGKLIPKPEPSFFDTPYFYVPAIAIGGFILFKIVKGVRG